MIDLDLDLSIDLDIVKEEKKKISAPFPIHNQQWEKIINPFEAWLYSSSIRGMFLGFRKCGKTDLITIYSISKWLSENPQKTVIIMTRKQDRADMILRKIGANLKSIGIQGVFGSRKIYLNNNDLKQPTVVGTTTSSTTKMYHADLLICDDPVEPRDEYSRAFKQRAELVFDEAKNIATKVFVIGQYVAIDDLYVNIKKMKNVDIFEFWIKDAQQDLIEILELDLDDLRQNKSMYGKNYEGIFYPSEDSPFAEILIGDYPGSYQYALLDPSNGKNDYSAIVYLKDYGDFVAIYGKMYKTDWMSAVDAELPVLQGVERFYWEENTIGASGYAFFKERLGTKAYRFTTTQNKVAKILNLVQHVKSGKIRISRHSDKIFLETVRNWSPKGGNNQIDDGLDALAMILERVPLLRPRVSTLL